MAVLVSWPRTKLIVVPVYLSARVPVVTTQLLVPDLKVSSVTSLARMSLRAAQPL
jgi:hypothetical protein